MSNFRQLIQIRTKKLGLLIFDARNARRLSLEECAQAVGVTAEEFQAYEKGGVAPGLPQIELLALFLNIPLDHFWGKKALNEMEEVQTITDKKRLVQLRNRMIGTNLRLARNAANFSYQEMTERSGIAEEKLKAYETGEAGVPLPELEVLAQVLDIPIERFYDHNGPIGRWRNQQSNIQRFLQLPPEIQDFVCKPVNQPYLELAIRLSELNAEKLRGVAETLLEITY
jgi:transcriptional regulator with XRE-family HTH domain